METDKKSNNKISQEELIFSYLKDLEWQVSLDNLNVLVAPYPEEYLSVFGGLDFYGEFYKISTISPELYAYGERHVLIRPHVNNFSSLKINDFSKTVVDFSKIINSFQALVKNLNLKINYSDYEKEVKNAEDNLKHVQKLYGVKHEIS